MICPQCGANVVNDVLRLCPYCGAAMGGGFASASTARTPAGYTPPTQPEAPFGERTQPESWQAAAYAPTTSERMGAFDGGFPFEPANTAAPSRGRMTASMVLGIVSVATAWFGWGALAGVVTGVIALVLGIPAKKRAPIGAPTGMATAGIVCGAIGLGISAIVFSATLIAYVAIGEGIMSFLEELS